MNYQKLGLIESLYRSLFKVRNVRKAPNLGILLLLGNFLKTGLITFLYILHTAYWG